MTKKNKKEEKEEETVEQKNPIEVVQGLLQMITFMAGAINLEAANVLCQMGWCKELIQGDCPICEKEKENKD